MMLSRPLMMVFTIFMGLLAQHAQANSNLGILQFNAPEVIVHTSKAELCLSDTKQCFPALVGPTTPLGKYDLTLYSTNKKGYGGDILGFKINGPFIFALHRVWLGKPSERRLERIRSNNPAERNMTNGCINVENDVYDLIKSKGYKTITIL